MIPRILYHGVVGPSVYEILRTFELRPPLRQKQRLTKGHGPHGNPETVYLSDTFAISYAVTNWDQSSPRALVEVELPDWTSYFRINEEYVCNLLVPDQTYYIMKTFPQLSWSDAHSIRDPLSHIARVVSGKEPADYSYLDSYKEFGSIGVYLGKQDSQRYLPIKRVAIFETDTIDIDLCLQLDKLEPNFYDEDTLNQLRELHKAFFTGEIDGVAIIDSATHRIPRPYRQTINTYSM